MGREEVRIKNYELRKRRLGGASVEGTTGCRGETRRYILFFLVRLEDGR
jgi:hypothetical protein